MPDNKKTVKHLKVKKENSYMSKIDDIFPLKIIEEGTYLGMGEYGSRYKLMTNRGEKICYSSYEPEFIDLINKTVGKLKVVAVECSKQDENSSKQEELSLMNVMYQGKEYIAKRFSELTSEEVNASTDHPLVWSGEEIFIKKTDDDSNEWSYMFDKEIEIISH